MNNEILKMRLSHLGEIGFRLSLFGLIIALAVLTSSFISFFVIAIIALIGFVLPIITLGIPIAINPNYFSDLTKLLDNANSVVNFLWSIAEYVKYVAVIGFVGSIIGAVFLLSNKSDRHWGKFVFCLFSSICCVLLFIFIATSTFQQGVIS